MKTIVIERNERRIETKIYGRGSRHILFYHGLGSSASAIPNNEEVLERNDCSLICFNRPGSSQLNNVKAYTAQDIAADSIRVLNQLGIGQCIVAGWSAGGIYAMEFARLYPKRTIALHLISSALPFKNEKTRSVLPKQWKKASFYNNYLPLLTKIMMQRMHSGIQKDVDKVLQQLIEEMSIADRKIATEFIELIRNSTIEGYANKGNGVYCDVMSVSKASTDLTSIKAPVTIWQGAEDTIWTIDTARYLHHEIKGSKLFIIENAGHLFYLSHWEELVEAMSRTRIWGD